MSTLLHLDSSPMGDRSVSRHMSATFTEHWKKAHADGKVIRRDINETKLFTVDAAYVAAVYTPADARTPEQNALLALSDELIAELMAADEWVLGVPMHNFGVPAVMKQWIDQVARVGVTFAYVDGKPKGLISNKKVTILIAAGGSYDPGTVTAGLNFVEPYLKTVLGFLGVSNIAFHTAGGAASLNYGVDRKEFLAPHDIAVAELAAK